MTNRVPFFRTIDRRLHYGLYASFMCITIFEFALEESGGKLGIILSNLSLAFVASYIFYVVVIHMKYVNDKEHLDPYIALKNRQLINSIRVLTHQLLLNSGVDAEIKYPEEQQLKEISYSTKFSDSAPVAYQRTNSNINTMYDFFYHWKNISQERLNDILSCSQYLESDHMRLLLHIQESSLYSVLDIFKKIKIDSDFSFLSSDLYSLSQSAKSLEEYCDANYSNTVDFNGEI